MILTVISEPKIFTAVVVKVFIISICHEETLEKATTLMVTGQPDNRRILMLKCFLIFIKTMQLEKKQKCI